MKKVLRAIGGFFAKIGRWIANTAWVQPLLIVGGIFAIIFSIPYIKSWVESWGGDEVNEDYEYYKSRALSLTGARDHKSKVDELFTCLETYETDPAAKTKLVNTYGEKFFLSFIKEGCSYCSECVDGYRSLSSNFSAWGLDKDEQGKKLPGFKLHTIRLDAVDDEDDADDTDYLAKYVFEEHQEFFDEVVAEFQEWGDYPLLNNISSSQRSSLESSIGALCDAINDNGAGLETPTTLFIDLTEEGKNREVNAFGVTAIFFNYTTYIDGSAPYDKGTFLKECWTYQNLFDPETFLDK